MKQGPTKWAFGFLEDEPLVNKVLCHVGLPESTQSESTTPWCRFILYKTFGYVV